MLHVDKIFQRKNILNNYYYFCYAHEPNYSFEEG